MENKFFNHLLFENEVGLCVLGEVSSQPSINNKYQRSGQVRYGFPFVT